MDKPIKVGNGILSQIEKDYYYTGILTRKGVFNFYMDLMEDFYKEYPYAIKWDYEKYIREILNYYEYNYINARNSRIWKNYLG